MRRALFRLLKRQGVRALLSLLILGFFLLHAGRQLEWQFIHNLERMAYDMRLLWTLPATEDRRVVIVDIDEKSLQEVGRWPWGRNVLAQLLDRLFDTYQVNLVGFDAVFPEPDQSSGLKILQKLAQDQLKHETAFQRTLAELSPELDYDALFAEAIWDRRVVLGYAFINQHEGDATATGQLPPPLLQDIQNYPRLNLRYGEAAGYAANLPAFTAAATASGFFNSLPDDDGISRRVPLLYGYQGHLYASLALEMARLYLGSPEVELRAVAGQGGYSRVEALGLDHRSLPVDELLRMQVAFRGGRGSFPYVSASDVIHGRVADPALLKNAIVLIGTTAQGLYDLRATPVAEVFPGVEVHANLISSILDNRFLSAPAYTHGAEVLLLLLVGLLLLVLLPLSNPLLSTLTTSALAGLAVWMNMLFWQQEGLVLPIASQLLLILSLFLFNMSYGYFVESRSRHETMRLFGQYVPPQLVAEMSKNPDAISMESESREMTVLFSDVRGFTSISERLSPKDLSALMNTFLTPMTHIIHEHRGTIDKYMGDAIMAFWGAPLHTPDHACRALDAALEMVARLRELQPQFHAQGWPELRVGVGINSGVMNVGNMGSAFRMAYTVLGDAVNLGSRLEGLTKQYGVDIIVSESTRAAVASADYVFRELDYVRVKGKDKPVAIYQPVGRREQLDPALQTELSDYAIALRHYRQQEWATALHQFSDLAAAQPGCVVYQVYLERIRLFQNAPPGADWDGVFTHTSK